MFTPIHTVLETLKASCNPLQVQAMCEALSKQGWVQGAVVTSENLSPEDFAGLGFYTMYDSPVIDHNSGIQVYLTPRQEHSGGLYDVLWCGDEDQGQLFVAVLHPCEEEAR